MTIIAAKVYDNQVVMCCDSYVSGNNFRCRFLEKSKIIQTEHLIIGFSGVSSIFTLLDRYVNTQKFYYTDVFNFCVKFKEYCTKINMLENTDFSLLIADHNHNLYTVYDWVPEKVNTHAAIGSGEQVALTCFHLNHDPRSACETACELISSCNAPIYIYDTSILKGSIIND